ncbi:hypothetical protein CYMTET_17842 [Cymbomonas tetramitiformis]|uniref:Uncharacterized protein n=1 Tax=Cymbomonas tetramitiformis TaxID=36881 RepID=A0AAE0L6J8_9CHLO|nr:hypothetical protein CYMTET_17842 [Cymbomonas tetramitiformis]
MKDGAGEGAVHVSIFAGSVMWGNQVARYKGGGLALLAGAVLELAGDPCRAPPAVLSALLDPPVNKFACALESQLVSMLRVGRRVLHNAWE